MDVLLPCKFAENGCKYVGTRSELWDHMIWNDCSFDKKIECQNWSCTEMVSMENMVDHMKAAHKSSVLGTNGKAVGKLTKIHATGRWSPSIFELGSNIFLIQARTERDDWLIWVVLMGTEEDAKKYEVTMTIQDDQGLPLAEFPGKVFSNYEKNKVGIVEEGVLQLDKAMAENVATKNADGNLSLKVFYDIIRK